MDSTSADTATIVELFLRFNRRLMFIVRATPHQLSVDESQILIEISHQPGITARDCASRLGIEKSVFSRTIAAFEGKGLVTRRSSPLDAREKQLHLLAAGKSVAAHDFEIRNRMAAECVAPLSSEEREELCSLLHAVGDGLGARALETSTSDEPAKIAIRRLTRAMGFLGRNFLDTGYSIEKFQILAMIGLRDAPLPLRELRRALPYDTGTISHIISRFTREKVLRRRKDAEDNRGANISLTADGRKSFLAAWSRANAVMSRGLSPLSASERARLIALLLGFLDADGAHGRSDLAGRMVILPIRTEDDRRRGRAFLLEELVRSQAHTRVPGYLLAPPHVARMIMANGKVCGVCEAVRDGGGWKYSLFVVEDNCPTEVQEQLIEATVRAVQGRKSLRPNITTTGDFPGRTGLLALLSKHKSAHSRRTTPTQP